MADGLRVWDESGTLIFDETTQTIKMLGLLGVGTNYTGGANSGSIVDGRFTQYPGHVGFFARIDGGASFEGYDATFSISGNTLSWSFPNPGQYPNQVILYGIR
jgi:hypothetical protein